MGIAFLLKKWFLNALNIFEMEEFVYGLNQICIILNKFKTLQSHTNYNVSKEHYKM